MQTSTVTNHEAALILLNIASILDATAGNPYRVRAYRRAARMLPCFQCSIRDARRPRGAVVSRGCPRFRRASERPRAPAS